MHHEQAPHPLRPTRLRAACLKRRWPRRRHQTSCWRREKMCDSCRSSPVWCRNVHRVTKTELLRTMIEVGEHGKGGIGCVSHLRGPAGGRQSCSHRGAAAAAASSGSLCRWVLPAIPACQMTKHPPPFAPPPPAACAGQTSATALQGEAAEAAGQQVRGGRRHRHNGRWRRLCSSGRAKRFWFCAMRGQRARCERNLPRPTTLKVCD